MQVGSGSGEGGPFFAAGQRIDRYELVAPIHRGASSAVWVARQRHTAGLERLVAVRLAHAPAIDDPRFREAVLQEVRLASGVSHPNVAQVVDFGETTGLMWVVSEYVDGPSLAELREVLDAKRLKVPAAILLRVLADTCAGLHAAHLLRDRNGGLLNVVHGNVSPRSIVLGANGVARVVDLGYAKAAARAAGGPNRRWLGDTGAPAPPPGQRIDRHADVWAVGAILEQMLAHVVAGAGGAEAGHSVPAVVRELARRATSTDPVERFATAAEMQGAIEAAMVTLGIPTTAANVASFAAEHTTDRAIARATEIDQAISDLGPLSRAEPPPGTIDSIAALAHTVSPAPLAIAPSPPSQALERREITGDALPQLDLPSHALFSPPPATLPPPRNVPRGLVAGAAALGVLALGLLGLRAARGPEPLPPPAAAVAPVPPPKPTCPTGMIEIPGGHFFMGSDDDLDLEKPAHHVVLAPYCMDRFEVTTEQYKACSDAGDCKRPSVDNKWPQITKADSKAYDPLCNFREPMARAKHPINCVDWDMAQGYCAAHKKRLPTEAEWEFAARGPDGRKYPWGDEEPGPTELNACGKECLAWGKKNHVELAAMYDGDDGWATTAPVGSFPGGKSRYGVEDVVGNVWEWTGDWFGSYTADGQDNPVGPKTGDERVIRGGAWNGAYPSWVRPTFRYHNDPATRSYGVGFRCAKPLE